MSHLASAVGLRIRKSIIFVSYLIKQLRPEMRSTATNYMPEIVSDSSYDFKKMVEPSPKVDAGSAFISKK